MLAEDIHPGQGVHAGSWDLEVGAHPGPHLAGIVTVMVGENCKAHTSMTCTGSESNGGMDMDATATHVWLWYGIVLR